MIAQAELSVSVVVSPLVCSGYFRTSPHYCLVLCTVAFCQLARPFILVFAKCTHGHTDGQLLLARRSDGLSDSLEFWNSWMLARFWAMRSCTDITYELLEVTHTGLDAAHLVRPFGTDTRELCQAFNIEPWLAKEEEREGGARQC